MHTVYVAIRHCRHAVLDSWNAWASRQLLDYPQFRRTDYASRIRSCTWNRGLPGHLSSTGYWIRITMEYINSLAPVKWLHPSPLFLLDHVQHTWSYYSPWPRTSFWMQTPSSLRFSIHVLWVGPHTPTRLRLGVTFSSIEVRSITQRLQTFIFPDVKFLEAR